MGLQYDANPRSGTTLSHAGSLLRHPDFELIYGVDERPDQRANFTRLTDRPAFDWSKSLHTLPRADVVIVATPTSTHPRILEEALRLKPRSVLLEKPAAQTEDQAARMLNVADDAGVDVFINYMRSADANLIHMHEVMSPMIRANFVTGTLVYTGQLLHSGSHGLHLLRSLLGSIHGGELRYPAESGRPSTEPTGGLIEFKHGRITLVPLPPMPFETLQVHLWGRMGQLSIRGRLSDAEFAPWTWDALFEGERVLGESTASWQASEGTYQLQVLTQLSGHLRGEPTTLCRLREAVELQIELAGLRRVVPEGEA